MFEKSKASHQECAAEIGALLGQLAALSSEVDDAELVDRIEVLEKVKAAAAAAQARMTAAFLTSQRSAQQAAGVPSKRWDRGISAQVALAKRESPARAARYTGWAQVLVDELPRTFATLEQGETTEWRAMVVARETIWLSRADRATVDAALADRLRGLGDRQVEAEARKLAYQLDPAGFVARARAAANDRRVSLRPAPDTMTRLTALLPAAQGVAAYAALARAADVARSGGDERGRGQVMADTLVERVTGQSAAAEVPVNVNLVMTDRTLFSDAASSGPNGDAYDDSDASGGSSSASGRADRPCRSVNVEHQAGFSGRNPSDRDDCERPSRDDDEHESAGGNYVGSAARSTDGGQSERGRRRGGGRHEPAHLSGYGPIPAGVARDLVRVKGARAWLRRLYLHPRSGDLAAMESRARIFPERIRHAVILRDQLCRTPWCGAPIRHADHARSVTEGGETSLSNGQGLCEACNYAKDSSGWHSTTGPHGTGESVTIRTPTGHQYLSEPPGLPGSSLHVSATVALALLPPQGEPLPVTSAAEERAA